MGPGLTGKRMPDNVDTACQYTNCDRPATQVVNHVALCGEHGGEYAAFLKSVDDLPLDPEHNDGSVE